MIGARYHLLAVRYGARRFVTVEDVTSPERRVSAPYQGGGEDEAAARALAALMVTICPERQHRTAAWFPDMRPIYDRRHTARAELAIVECSDD